MTLDSKHSKDVYQGNGSTTVFPFAFKVWNTSQITVTMTDAAGSTDVTSNSTVTLTSSGGSVTYPKTGSPLPSGAKLAITRNMPFTQGINLTTASRFDPQVLEDGLDQGTAERQQIVEMMARAVILPPTSSDSPEGVVASIYASCDAAAVSAQNASNKADAAAGSATAAANSATDSHTFALAAAQSAAEAEAASGGMAPRMDAVEAENATQNTRLTNIETKNTTQDTRLSAAETSLAGKADINLGNATGNAISQYLHVCDEKPSGTSGGSTTGGTWQTRDLNTIKVNRISGSLANNRITLPGGRYYIRAAVPVFAGNAARAALFNYTAATYLLYSSSYFADYSYNGHPLMLIEGEFLLADTATLELRMWVQTSYTYGMGRAASISGVTEKYSEAVIWKL